MNKTYEIMNNGAAIKCSMCGLTSYHPDDVKHRYCGNCHLFHDDHYNKVQSILKDLMDCEPKPQQPTDRDIENENTPHYNFL